MTWKSLSNVVKIFNHAAQVFAMVSAVSAVSSQLKPNIIKRQACGVLFFGVCTLAALRLKTQAKTTALLCYVGRLAGETAKS